MNTILQQIPTRYVLQHITPFRSILAGAGFAYAIEKENYIHLPVVLVFPAVYAGYHLYKNKNDLINLIKNK
jgi:hypothetical protein